MPRVPIDYSETLIYKLVCNDVEVTELYVGSTTNFKNRKNGHKSKCHNPNSPKYNYKVYQFIRANNGFHNWSMVVVERYPCNDKLECTKRERYWIETLHATLNSNVPSRTKQEYRIINKDYINEQIRQYCLDNKEYLLEQKRKKNVCNCGITYTSANKTQHCRTQKHIRRINLFETVDSIICEYQSQQI